MSVIRVNKLENTNTSNGGISIDTSGHVSIDGQQLPSAGPLSNRNLIINGAMQVAQRGTSFTSAGEGYTLDRWRFNENTPAAFDVVKSSIAPAGFTSSLKIDCTTTGTPTSTQEAFIEQKIEAQNLQHLQYGTLGAQSVTFSFWIRSNKTGNYGLWIYQEDAASQYATTYTISSADTWEYKTITIPGNTTTAINNDNGIGLSFRFYLQAGSTYAGTPAETWTTSLNSNRTTSLNLGDSASNEWLLSGVQLEVGETATPFEHRSYGDELARCQRYYQYTPAYGLVAAARSSGTAALLFNIPLITSLRATPILNNPALRAYAYNTFYDSSGSLTINFFSSDGTTLVVTKSGFSGLTDDRSYNVFPISGSEGFRLDAEL